ncbi:hypothetical protein HanXRQr2_Chr11g0508011 [Helianthus annuus]|uniref:Uncharacterized protein n=1 Tax=Helianthus annuus TaxID=4232 RepID=A0A9K3N1W0_HELAN|nr:hypothetical protein HanXRQr2_Chr11g0508011 [Helianthus annuus]
MCLIILSCGCEKYVELFIIYTSELFRSVLPRGKKYSRKRSYSRSLVRTRSPPYNGGSMSLSRSLVGDSFPPPDNNGSRRPSQSLEREKPSPT